MTAAPETQVGRVAMERHRLIVRGVVQGVGFRPFVARLADELGLTGHCGNDEVSVFVEAQGPQRALVEFAERVRRDAPPLAVVLGVTVEHVSEPVEESPGFRIVPSLHTPGARTLIPPDVGICADCAREMADPADRRYRHPFVNCTNCGPRYTVVTDLPYDRPATTMASFPMCARCAREYEDPADRRYHAQPICCPECGPRLFAEEEGVRIDGDDAVLALVQQVIEAGGIVAVKGIGGFHLVCDATDPVAVRRLRDRKQRPAKPFAVMAADLTAAREVCAIDDAEAAVLGSPARPIVLLRKGAADAVASEVAPGLDELGLLLPYAPVHHLLFARVPGGRVPPRLLVMTSGNLGGEPLCFTNEDARQRLSGIADVFLMHDRDIAVPCEDSVLTVVDGEVQPIRRSRGYAPLPVLLDGRGPTVLAVGAEVKNTFCLTRQDFAFCSGHLGDMGSLESRRAFERAVAQLSTLHDVRPHLVVADEHPGYSTRNWAEDYSARTRIPLATVQHHHAHVAALAAEHHMIGTPLLGIAFDGTGYGCDRTVWGGEMLLVGTDLGEATRVGHLQPFSLPGGDVAVRNPARVALALLTETGLLDSGDLPCVRALASSEWALVAAQLRSGLGCVRTTSVGRLFDGVASILDVRHRITYEGQAAVELEALARTAARPAALTMRVSNRQLLLGDLLAGLVDGVRNGTPLSELACGFHRALASATAALAIDIARTSGIETVGLTGGVFQNRMLTTLVRTALQAEGLRVLTHHVVPPNDGGLSLGQAALGTALLGNRCRARTAIDGVQT